MESPISQKLLALDAEELVHGCFRYVALLVQVPKDVLSYLGLLFGCCPTKLVETNVKPVVHISMNGMVLVTNLLRRQALLQGLCFGGGTIFICATDV